MLMLRRESLVDMFSEKKAPILSTKCEFRCKILITYCGVERSTYFGSILPDNLDK